MNGECNNVKYKTEEPPKVQIRNPYVEILWKGNNTQEPKHLLRQEP